MTLDLNLMIPACQVKYNEVPAGWFDICDDVCGMENADVSGSTDRLRLGR